MLSFYLGLPKQYEILLIIFLGIFFLSLDFSLFQLKSNMEKIWHLQLVRAKFLEIAVKYILATVVLVRTFTLHVFLAFYIMMLWPAIFEEKPSLMLPWLLLGIIRCIFVNIITLLLGLLICHQEKGISPICWDFILAEIIEHGPSVYAWLSVRSYYREISQKFDSQRSSFESMTLYNTSTMISENTSKIQSNAIVEDDLLKKTKSYSLSDLNLDYLCSSKANRLSASMSLEDIILELKELFEKKRLLRDSSMSLDSLIRNSTNESLDSDDSTFYKLSIFEKATQILDISNDDFLSAKLVKGRFEKELADIAINKDIENMSTHSRSYKNVTKNKLLDKKPKIYFPKSHSQNENGTVVRSCYCYIRKQLQLEQSNQTLFECEIASVTLNESLNSTQFYQKSIGTQNEENTCSAFKSNQEYSECTKESPNTMDEFLNTYRVVVGQKFNFNPSLFLQKFIVKKNTSRNFGCQVSMLKQKFFEQSRNQFMKKLMFLRNLGFSS